MIRAIAGLTAIAIGTAAAPAIAQEEPEETIGAVIESAEPASADEEDTVFDDTWLGVGVGVRYDSSYDGSDDYGVGVLPAVTGRIAGVGFSPRSAGLAINVLNVKLSDDVTFGAGPVGRLRSNRARKIKDPVVEAAGLLDKAIEVGATVGFTFRRVLNKYDRLSIGSDLRWDVNGAHRGFVADPGISYRTPLSRGTVVSASLGAVYGSGDFNRYYFDVSPAQSAASGLPLYSAKKGFYKAGGSLAFGVDLDGDIQNGGFIVGAIVGYSRMLGDGKRSPYTSIRGSADQFYAATGVGFVF